MRYMVRNTIVRAPDDHFFGLFPQEQARVAELMADGTLLGLYVAADYSGAWLIMGASTTEAVQQIIASLPLASFFQSEITPLAETAA